MAEESARHLMLGSQHGFISANHFISKGLLPLHSSKHFAYSRALQLPILSRRCHHPGTVAIPGRLGPSCFV